MKASINVIKLIDHFEGLRLKPYQDSKGIWTIGLGTTIYPNGKKVTKTDPPIDKEMAYDLALIHMKSDQDMVNALIKQPIEQCQFDAIIVFIYNVGIGNFQKSTLLKLINKNPKDHRIWGAFLLFNKEIKNDEVKESDGLTRRRNSEAHLYFKNEINFYENLL